MAEITCSVSSSALGAWWVPDRPAEQVAGTFGWDPESGATLDLLGFFANGPDPADFEAAVVHGAAEQREYTLINCHTAQFNLRVPGIVTQQLRPFGGVLVGCNHPDPSADDFDRLTIDIEHLAELASWSHITHHRSSSDGETIDELAIEYEHPRALTADLRDERVQLASEWRTGSSGVGHSEVVETVRFVVDTRAPTSLHALVERYVAPLRDLVTFAAQTPPVIRSVRVAGPFSTEQTASGRTIKRALELLLPFLEGRAARRPERLRRRLLSIPTDPRGFRALIGSWLRIREELAPVIDLRFAATYARFMYGENRFANAVQSVEALHRRVLVGDPDPSDIEARDAALDACPPEHRPWLESKLQYAHEPTLRRRLRETLDFIGSGIKPVIGHRGRFVNAVVTTRNALTHWDQQAHNRRKTGDLHGLALVLGYVVDAALLRLLGFTEDEVRESLQANEHFVWVASRFATP